MRHPLLEYGERNLWLAEPCATAARIAEERQRPFGVHKARRPAERRAEPLRDLTYRNALRTGHVENRRRRRAELEAAECVAVGVSLPDGVEEAHRQIDRLTGEHAPRDVHERAVTEVHGIVQTENHRRHAVLARDEFHDALASEARLRILAYWCRGIVLRGSTAVTRDQRVHVACREDDDA